MTTETTTTALPLGLPEVTDEMVERAVVTYVNTYYAATDARRGEHGMRAALTEFRAALFAGIPQWQPIECDQIKAGMRIRATAVFGDYVATRTGVAHHTNLYGDWLTEVGLMVTGWSGGDPTSYEVDSATIPADPDADLIETVAETLYRTDWPSDVWDGLSVEAYREVARAALTVIRESEANASEPPAIEGDEAVMGDE